jgi:hypothetical protein
VDLVDAWRYKESEIQYLNDYLDLDWDNNIARFHGLVDLNTLHVMSLI